MHYHRDIITHSTAFVAPIGSTGWSKSVTHRLTNPTVQTGVVPDIVGTFQLAVTMPQIP